jgi:asparagine synthase (glutamine-hydrolysing)
MCGFVAMFNKDQAPVDASLLAAMAETIVHRGPDGQGILIEGPCGFAHKRLAIIDPEGGRQPMTVGPVTVVQNGEIYNYLELRRELERVGHVFQTRSDTEVLARAYLAYGPDCVRHFNGMFAFVLWDRSANRLLAARDHFGIKPLYVWDDGRRLLFASEIKALLRHPAVPAAPNMEAIQDYAVFQYVLNEDTFFRGVRKVSPAHSWIIDLGTFAVERRRYWEPDFSVDTHHTEEYFVESLRALLEDAVALQLRSDVPLGVTLSGGIDSSLVTSLAARRLGGRLTAFTGAFNEGPEFDETRYAEAVATACGAELEIIRPGPADFIEVFPKLIYHMDEPMAGPGLFPQYMVARRAAGRVKVLLGGQGGDEIFGGYTRYVIAYLEQALKGAVYETNDEGEHIVSLKSILPNLPALRGYVPTLRSFWAEGLFESMDRRYFRLIDRSRGARDLFGPDFNAAFDEERVFARFRTVFEHPRTHSYYNKMVQYDLTAGLPALLHVEDRMTSACAVESRVPLLDRRIVDLVASMPPGLKFRGAEMKYILKRAVGDVLPPAVLARKDKMGFPVPLHIWMRNGLGDFVRDILTSRACRERGLFRTERVEELISGEEPFGRRLWGLLNLEMWFRTFIDKPAVPAAPDGRA